MVKRSADPPISSNFGGSRCTDRTLRLAHPTIQQETRRMNQADTVLVVGADGMIGRTLAERFTAAGHNVVRTALLPMPGATALGSGPRGGPVDAAAGIDRLSLRRDHFAGAMSHASRRPRGP